VVPAGTSSGAEGNHPLYLVPDGVSVESPTQSETESETPRYTSRCEMRFVEQQEFVAWRHRVKLCTSNLLPGLTPKSSNPVIVLSLVTRPIV